MTTTPLYEATVADLSFDPSALPPTPTRAERKRAHNVWEQAAWQRAKAGKSAKKRARKAAAS